MTNVQKTLASLSRSEPEDTATHRKCLELNHHVFSLQVLACSLFWNPCWAVGCLLEGQKRALTKAKPHSSKFLWKSSQIAFGRVNKCFKINASSVTPAGLCLSVCT